MTNTLNEAGRQARASYLAKPDSAPMRLVTSAPFVLNSTRVARVTAHHSIGRRVQWRGVVRGFGPRLHADGRRMSVGLTDVTEPEGVRVWAEVWFHYTPYLRSLGLTEGDVVTFTAQVERQLDGVLVLDRPRQIQRADDDVPYAPAD